MIFEKQVVGAYKSMMHKRCDGDGMTFYFSSDDFKGLNKEPFSFVSSAGNLLKGYIYSYESFDTSRLIVFDHGFGGGHRAYMKEIEKLCSHGYRVLSYDHTGCMESEGESPNGMAQSLCDLNDCISAIKKDPELSSLEISVMGHSWGGFSTLNIPAYHKDISHIVVLSGFVSVQMLVNSFFSGLMKGYRKPVMKIERDANPDFVNANAVETLSQANAKALLIYSDNDVMVKRSHYDALYNALKDKGNIEFILEKKKWHNPNYTTDAVNYLGEYISAKSHKQNSLKTEKQKSDFISLFDWNRMTTQDENVWDKIFEFLNS